MSRYLIVGAGGSGKSTLARSLSTRVNVPYHDTDAMYWRADWTLASDAEVIARLPLHQPGWVLDGNFVAHRATVWDAADTIIWLAYPAPVVLRRLLARNLRWLFSRRGTWTGRRMPWRRAYSGVRHFFSQYPRLQKTVPGFLQHREHQRVLIFRHPREAAHWLATFPASAGD